MSKYRYLPENVKGCSKFEGVSAFGEVTSTTTDKLNYTVKGLIYINQTICTGDSGSL